MTPLTTQEQHEQNIKEVLETIGKRDFHVRSVTATIDPSNEGNALNGQSLLNVTIKLPKKDGFPDTFRFQMLCDLLYSPAEANSLQMLTVKTTSTSDRKPLSLEGHKVCDLKSLLDTIQWIEGKRLAK